MTMQQTLKFDTEAQQVLPVNVHCVRFLWFALCWEMHEDWGCVDFHLYKRTGEKRAGY